MFEFNGYPAYADGQRAITPEEFAGAVDTATHAFYRALSESLSSALIPHGDVAPETIVAFERAASSAAWHYASFANVTTARATELGWDPANHG